MLLAVAGLKEEEIARRTKKLASGDWSDFSSFEQQSFQFAHKLTREPAAVNRQHVHSILNIAGPERTVDLIWYTGWCNYMTRVADAFQFPLERENVFADPKKESK
jgi:hypothetical protein